MNWWHWASEATEGLTRQGLNSLIILGAWAIWKHRNCCIFDGISPSVTDVLAQGCDERHMWELAGAKGISFLMAPLTGG